ncbi:hypothetical protein [Chryseobacterium jejuense]|uniref:Uncharacterized protein n=1 Tax=Chryseobacterium jejuense TaxID=445960 RepID=A0A2X2Z611_CHRJE|nr:hypothetical protein [Chryseobacterium jejuense]SDJ38311.1 hypothetical protein SAMN05421542_3379 [Chryseobacterium jejuense]SQB45880.1 Uncharacterised protein [Chryseobacterium jejuense]
MDELELLKKDWNKASDDFKEYSENEIYNMIKHKSVSITKTLLLIGGIEIILWTLYGYLDQQFPYLRVAMFLVFTGLIIYLFSKMKTGQNSIALMKSIMNLRTLILAYACISLMLAVVDSIIHFDHNVKDFIAGSKDGWNTAHHMNKLPTNPDTIVPVMANYIVFAIVLLITFYLLYIIYKRTYGKILHDLRKNYKELSCHEENPI